MAKPPKTKAQLLPKAPPAAAPKPVVTPVTSAPASTATVNPVTGFTSEQQSAYDYMQQVLNQYNLGSLSGALKEFILRGDTDSNTLMLDLQGTDAWKQRFAGNEALRAAGLNVLSPQEYLATETAYAQVLKQYGLPTGFYDDPSDFSKWIGSSVSPSELQQRASIYSDLANREDPSIQAQLLSMGLSQGDLMAWLMDPSRAMPLLQRKYQTALIGAAGRRAGVVSTDPNHLAEIGITEQQAIQGFGQIADELPTLTQLGHIYGDSFNESDAERAVFDQNAAAVKKRKSLSSQERAAFSGSSGVVSGSLAKNTNGTF